MIDKKQSSENRRILRIAIPSIISNITVPLLGLIDVTIVGHLGSPVYIGAIAVGECCLILSIDFRIPTHGDEWHDLTSVWAA